MMMTKKNKLMVCPICMEDFEVKVVRYHPKVKSQKTNKFTFFCSERCRDAYKVRQRKKRMLFGEEGITNDS